jgi:hypothetical protein
MTPAIEKPASSKTGAGETAFSEHTRLDVSCSRFIAGGSKFRSPDDEIVFRRWRLGVFLFYGAIALLLVAGFGMFADRPGQRTLGATAASNPAPISAEAATTGPR